MESHRKVYKPPTNTVYKIDGTSFGLDDGLVEALQTSIRTKLNRGTLVIPRLPQAAVRILQISEDVNLGMNEVTKVVMTDPLLAVRLLSIANSAAYGGHPAVKGLDQALARLGMRTVCNLVFAESIQSKVFSARAHRGLLEQSWRLSLGAALACESLSWVTRLETEGAFLMGLLHDTGKPALINAVSEYAHENKGRYLNEATVEILLSQLHEEIGAHVLRQWDMPAAAVDAAGAHHRYRSEGGNTPAHRLIYAANLVCQHLGIGEVQRDIPFTIEHVFQDLQLNDLERVNPILEQVHDGLTALLSGFANPPSSVPQRSGELTRPFKAPRAA